MNGLAAYGSALRQTDAANDQRQVRADAASERQLADMRRQLLVNAMQQEAAFQQWREQQKAGGQPAPVIGAGQRVAENAAQGTIFDGIYDDAKANFQQFPDALRDFNPLVLGYADGGAVQGDVFSRVLAFAGGGMIPDVEGDGEMEAIPGRLIEGPGTGTSDSIPAMIDGQTPAALSAGEFVIPAAVVKHYGVDFFEKLIDIDVDNEDDEESDGDEMAFAKGGAIPARKGRKC